jgi:hypothetical protein
MCPFAVEFFASALDAREGAPEDRHIVASRKKLAWLEDFEIEIVGERLKERGRALDSAMFTAPRDRTGGGGVNPIDRRVETIKDGLQIAASIEKQGWFFKECEVSDNPHVVSPTHRMTSTQVFYSAQGFSRPDVEAEIAALDEHWRGRTIAVMLRHDTSQIKFLVGDIHAAMFAYRWHTGDNARWPVATRRDRQRQKLFPHEKPN